MLSHTFLGTNDSERARTFYAPIMAALGWQVRVSPHLPHLAIWKPAGASRPLFVLGPPFDGGMADAGNGCVFQKFWTAVSQNRGQAFR